MRNLQVIDGERAFTARDFIGGDIALDFINTVSGRDRAPRDRLDRFERLIEWAVHAKILPAQALRRLAERASRTPAAAEAALLRATRMRENVFKLLVQIISGGAPSPRRLAQLRAHWMDGVRMHELAVENGCVVARLADGAVDFDSVTSIVAWRLVERVAPLAPGRLRICAGDDCAWLFIDTSKSGRRRWCDMSTCGNLAKSRRHVVRTLAAKRKPGKR